jgi:hypothetical protein
MGVVNNGERHRYAERISTGFVESTINQRILVSADRKFYDRLKLERLSAPSRLHTRRAL